jgi:hypothetical protein
MFIGHLLPRLGLAPGELGLFFSGQHRTPLKPRECFPESGLVRSRGSRLIAVTSTKNYFSLSPKPWPPNFKTSPIKNYKKYLHALPPKADIGSAKWDVRFGPAADSCAAAKNCYSITLSVRASRAGGTARPSALAVLRLMTSSYLVGACTGNSAGFSPLRMRST